MNHGGNIRDARERLNITSGKIIDFSANINPLGLSPRIKRIIKSGIEELVHYPDPQCKELRKSLAAFYGVDERNILPGNGSSELIYLLANIISPSRAMIVQPNFIEYENSLKHTGCKISHLIGRERDNFKISIEEIISSLTDEEIVYLSSPNNPVGYIYTKEELTALLKQCSRKKVYLCIDEVFIDFIKESGGISMMQFVESSGYLIVLRSLTKLFAIPGLRLGLIAANQTLINRLTARITPWSVNNLSQAVGSALNKNDDYINKTHSLIYKEREFLLKQISRLNGLKCFNSRANYILCKILSNKDIEVLERELAGYGLLIRKCSNYRGLSSRFFRIAVKNRNDNLLLLKLLKGFFND